MYWFIDEEKWCAAGGPALQEKHRILYAVGTGEALGKVIAREHAAIMVNALVAWHLSPTLPIFAEPEAPEPAS